MSFTKYRAFIRVVELGSITKAAAELGYSQPGVSRMLDSLEDELGITLLIRNNTSVAPTEEGRQILDHCREIVKHENDLFDLTNSIKGLICGKIRIGALNSMVVNYTPKIINTFSSAYPNIELILSEISFSQIIRQLPEQHHRYRFHQRIQRKKPEILSALQRPFSPHHKRKAPFRIIR